MRPSGERVFKSKIERQGLWNAGSGGQLTLLKIWSWYGAYVGQVAK